MIIYIFNLVAIQSVWLAGLMSDVIGDIDDWHWRLVIGAAKIYESIVMR